ncbi:50S ribosomal protein L35 [Candidatus Saccharibacteria bacterium]|nr:50S ribosomal protein L35 [Candidatus Saccharibacteria bacterium]NCU40365.1 50S ribosomal protein L35 [Candidatus Saccharibacteria bacterium]
MPKLKTHRGTIKRVRITGTGKLIRNRAFGHHKLANKSGSRKRRISTPSVITGKIAKNLKRAIGA